eukprot:CAMPEP_0196728024 /NCGR_PEP_ID=MMETSP1091-20130531/8852_1 /TAXON_ID=302021 /ORGANISM="Rhodomonas sp., Strain CCMP768" /LENGTH=60 /DNA_ID=CAMNT_0042070723 /DNA_START=14 /DNA_END=196 /DNA_ORIENTATION=-
MIEWIIVGGLAACPAVILMLEGQETAPCQAPRTKDISSYPVRPQTQQAPPTQSPNQVVQV